MAVFVRFRCRRGACRRLRNELYRNSRQWGTILRRDRPPKGGRCIAAISGWSCLRERRSSRIQENNSRGPSRKTDPGVIPNHAPRNWGDAALARSRWESIHVPVQAKTWNTFLPHYSGELTRVVDDLRPTVPRPAPRFPPCVFAAPRLLGQEMSQATAAKPSYPYWMRSITKTAQRNREICRYRFLRHADRGRFSINGSRIESRLPLRRSAVCSLIANEARLATAADC